MVEALFAIRQQQFNILLEMTRVNNHNVPIKVLVSMYEHILVAQLAIQRSALIIAINENVWECISYNGTDENFLKTDFSAFLREFSNVVEICPLSAYSQSEFEFIQPVLLKGKPIGYVLLGGIFEDKYDTKEEKLKFTQTLANVVCAAHENARLANLETQQKMVQRDIHLASEMQRMLIPASFPEEPCLQVSGFYKPFRDIGGDYYDFFKISENNYFFCICDVSGKGIPAAMLMANFQANVRLVAHRNIPLEEQSRILNESVYSVAQGDSFVTAFIGTINTKTGICEYVNAGHNAPYVVLNGNLSVLSEGCTILGAMPKLPKVKSGKINLLPSALLINYTDGITEVTNAQDEQFGEERLRQFVEKNHQLPIEMFNLKLIQDVLKFCENDSFEDDLSLLTIRYQKKKD